MDVLYQLAEPQIGYFSAAQAVAAGVSRRALASRKQRGDIERVRYGIYRLRHFPAHRFEDVAAACLWAGPGSAASHETALAIHGISDAMPAVIHLTVPRPFRGRQPGVAVHHASLPDDEYELRDGVPVTTVTRTLRDIATTSDPALVTQAVEESVSRGALSHRALRKLVREAPEIAPLVVNALGPGT